MTVSHRWQIAIVLAGASVMNYLDRSALGVAAPAIKEELHLNASKYALVINAFLIAYTISYGLGGMIVDRLGVRRSVICTVTCWSAANMAHALAYNLGQLIAFRFFLGLSEAMFYTAAIRGCAESFPAKDRSKPIGLILSGASAGALLAPIIVARMMDIPGVGWRGAFAFTGAIGFLLIPPWILLNRTGLAYPLENPSQEDEEHAMRPWRIREILGARQAWILIIIRSMTDAAWYLFLFWMLLYFQTERNFSVRMVAELGWIPFLASDIGALFGGWLSSSLIRMGFSIERSRKICMMSFAMMLPACLVGYLMPQGASLVTLALCSVATFGHMAWGTNELTLHSDLFPTNCVATIMGITGAAGAIGGIIAQQFIGFLVDSTGTYLPVFVAAAFLHPIAGLIVVFRLGSVMQLRRTNVLVEPAPNSHSSSQTCSTDMQRP